MTHPNILNLSLSNLSTSPIKKDEEKKNRRVSFGYLEIHQHSIIIGDSPSCKDSLPIGLSWEKYGETRRINVEEFEAERQNRRYQSLREMKLSLEERKSLLQSVGGLSKKEIQEQHALRYFVCLPNKSSLFCGFSEREIQKQHALRLYARSAWHQN
mmetsp:Transcript_8076/g.12354  ORF Transcript_8076/g.12354 Transcript_8076/m.12354 type:complete len:156 (-) Transcript_8076:47-514(-)